MLVVAVLMLWFLLSIFYGIMQGERFYDEDEYF
jgi:hypothetical protein